MCVLVLMSIINLLTQSSEQKRLPRVTRVYVCNSPEQRRWHIRGGERACNPLRHSPCVRASVSMCCGAAVCDYAWLMFARCLKCRDCFTAASVICSAGSSEGGRDDRKVRRLNPNPIFLHVCCHNSTVMCVNSVVVG